MSDILNHVGPFSSGFDDDVEQCTDANVEQCTDANVEQRVEPVREKIRFTVPHPKKVFKTVCPGTAIKGKCFDGFGKELFVPYSQDEQQDNAKRIGEEFPELIPEKEDE